MKITWPLPLLLAAKVLTLAAEVDVAAAALVTAPSVRAVMLPELW